MRQVQSKRQRLLQCCATELKIVRGCKILLEGLYMAYAPCSTGQQRSLTSASTRTGIRARFLLPRLDDIM